MDEGFNQKPSQFIIKVLVQLPDGSYQRLPIARDTGDGGASAIQGRVVRHDTTKGARDWTHFVLPGQVEYVKEERQS